ncbi:unnamed protein product [Menidia menidia]|uniref:(Atlantic silverside) hypothetical protein n=1 Tax=Menidia menidia TaxID=238744 RepID=A0A8S4AJ86_9TELE|nr:unnamed protein product [Menidia menidia]
MAKTRTFRSCIWILLFITWRESLLCNGLEVLPPKDISVFDPGRLGFLEITWSTARSSINMTKCSVMYHLEYYNTYRDRWDAVRTVARSYSAQFNLMEDIKVRVYTLLNGPCTNNTMIKSKTYTEMIQKPPGTGIQDTGVQDLNCLFYNMEHMLCEWKRSKKTPATSQHHLYFWHKNLEHAVECPKYIMSGGVRSGCNLTENPLPLFKDINFCVNGTSHEGDLRPTCITVQMQNHVKAAATQNLHLQAGPDKQLELHWEDPVGKVPGHCLEWEVEQSQEGADGTISLRQITTKDTKLTIAPSPDTGTNCFRVRSEMIKYCADEGIWSDWSPQACYPVLNKMFTTPEPGQVLVPVAIAIAIVSLLVLSLCVWLAVRMRISSGEKKLFSLLSALFSRNHAHREACEGKETCPHTVI